MPLDLLERRLRTRPGHALTLEEPAGRAAVAVVFRPGPDLLFIRRAEREGDPWSGHMAFPGGRWDPADPDLQVTAERETREEVGLDLGVAGWPLGRLDDLATPQRAAQLPRMVIRPYVYGLHADPPLEPNHEVAAVCWFSLSRLLSGEGRGTMQYNWQGVALELPCVRLDGALVWGLTLRLLDDLLERLGPQDAAP